MIFGRALPIDISMGWLWNEIHHMFDIADNSFPEICICGLSEKEVVAGYQILRKSGSVAGGPRIFTLEANGEVEIDEVECAATLVCRKQAEPFHFMMRNLAFADGKLHEIGVFILDNAIALDYEKSPIWGEIQIETFLLLINAIMGESSTAFIRLEDDVSPEDKERLEQCLSKLKTPDDQDQ